jgi:hypothetical protein
MLQRLPLTRIQYRLQSHAHLLARLSGHYPYVFAWIYSESATTPTDLSLDRLRELDMERL